MDISCLFVKHNKSLVAKYSEDVAQEVWIKVINSISTLTNPEAFPAWLHAIALNTSIDMRPLETPRLPQEPEETSVENRVLLTKYTQALSGDAQEILYMFYSLGLTHEEIATIQGKSKLAVKAKLRRIRRYLNAK